MNAQELWNKYKKINPSIGDDIDAWQFGVEADLLAQLVLEGTKTATASAYDLYAVDNDPLPEFVSFKSRKFLLCHLIRCQQSTLSKKAKVIGH